MLPVFVGIDGAIFTNASDVGGISVVGKAFEKRAKAGIATDQREAELMKSLSAIQDAFIITIQPLSVRCIGTRGSFNMTAQDQRDRAPKALEAAVQHLMQSTAHPVPRSNL